ncbi:MAG: FAD-dependent oxidoreductase [Pseudomonadota bacterium]
MSGTGKHIIIGNSAAALAAVRAIRRAGDDRPIVLVSAENLPAYSPVLTTYYIAGGISRKNMFLVDADFYRRHRVKTILGRRVVEVDPDRRLVVLGDRTRLEYGDLLIAAGASARPLERVAPDAAGLVCTLRTLEDAERIRALGQKASEVVVIGAGLVSLQTVKALLRPGLKITVAVGSDQVLSQQLDRESAGIIQGRLEAGGVDILFGRGIDRVTRRGTRVEATTSYGETLPADLVVVGKGVRANTDLVRGTAIRTGRGVIVDDRMRTSVPDVYAAGDVAEGENQVSGEREVIATWFNAAAQGEIAGLNMAGRPARRTGQLRENVTTLLGVVVAVVGQSRPDYGRYEEIKHLDSRRGVVRKFFFDGPVLAGALLIGSYLDAGVIRHCIAERLDLSAWKSEIAATPLDFGKILAKRGLDLSISSN